MRRIVSIVLAAAILCLALTACGSRQKTDLSKATTIADLKGAVIAGQAGTFHLDVIDQIEGVEKKSYPDFTDLLNALKSGAIDGYVALINPQAVGIDEIFFVEITLDHHDEAILERFGAALARMPEVLEAHLVTGDYDYLVKIAVADRAHYERFLRQTLYRVAGIKHTRSTFALRALKREVSVDPLLI